MPLQRAGNTRWPRTEQKPKPRTPSVVYIMPVSHHERSFIHKSSLPNKQSKYIHDKFTTKQKMSDNPFFLIFQVSLRIKKINSSQFFFTDGWFLEFDPQTTSLQLKSWKKLGNLIKLFPWQPKSISTKRKRQLNVNILTSILPVCLEPTN